MAVPEAPRRPVGLSGPRALPDHAELAGRVVVFVEIGVDWSREARFVHLGRNEGSALLRRLVPGCADLDIASEDPEVRAAVAASAERGKLCPCVEMQRPDEPVERAVCRLRETTDVSHCHAPAV